MKNFQKQLILKIAKFYFDNKLSLIRLKSNAKIPIGKNWTELKSDFSIFESYYKYHFVQNFGNIGINCEPSNLIVLDIDTKNDKQNGLNALTEHLGEEKWEIVKNTFTVRTQSGGYHLYFRTNKIIKTNHSKWLPGIDVQCSGAFVVAPPSVINNNPYEIRNEKPIQQIPDFLLNELLQYSKNPKLVPTPTLSDVQKLTHEYIKSKKGMRNSALNLLLYTTMHEIKNSCSRLSKVIRYEDLRKLVHEVAIINKWEGYNQQEFDNVIASVYNTVQSEPIQDIGDITLAHNIYNNLSNTVYYVLGTAKETPFMHYEDGIWHNEVESSQMVIEQYNNFISPIEQYINHLQDQLKTEDDNRNKGLINIAIEKQKSFLSTLLSNKKRNSVTAELKNVDGFTKKLNQFDVDESILVLKNGVYSFDDKKLYNHDPKYLSTKKINLNYTGKVNYVCKFYKLLEYMFENKEERDFLLLALGYGLIHKNHLKKFFILQVGWCCTSR